MKYLTRVSRCERESGEWKHKYELKGETIGE